MDISKPSAADAANRTPPAPLSPQSSSSSNVAAADRASIRPLDGAAALKILLAEVRAALDAPDTGNELGTVDDPVQAARVLVNVFLQALPDDGGLPAVNQPLAVSQRLVNAGLALQTGLERGIIAMNAWEDVPSSVVDAAHETRALVLLVLGDDPQNPAWLRPEWIGFAPRLERFWRRRRFARRVLTDPDYAHRHHDIDDDRS
jgi:hypothetical protein